MHFFLFHLFFLFAAYLPHLVFYFFSVVYPASKVVGLDTCHYAIRTRRLVGQTALVQQGVGTHPSSKVPCSLWSKCKWVSKIVYSVAQSWVGAAKKQVKLDMQRNACVKSSYKSTTGKLNFGKVHHNKEVNEVDQMY